MNWIIFALVVALAVSLLDNWYRRMEVAKFRQKSEAWQNRSVDGKRAYDDALEFLKVFVTKEHTLGILTSKAVALRNTNQVKLDIVGQENPRETVRQLQKIQNAINHEANRFSRATDLAHAFMNIPAQDYLSYLPAELQTQTG